MLRPATVVLALLSPAAAVEGRAEEWRIDTRRSELTVHVRAAGALSAFLHDHYLRPTEWSGTVRFDPSEPEAAAVDVTIDARALENHQPALSEDDHQTVRGQIEGPDVLDVERHPEIRFAGSRLDVAQRDEGSLTGTLHGTLTVRGTTAPIALRVTADWSADRLRARAASAFDQSAFGIEPYRRFLGTVAIRDALELELLIEATRADQEAADSAL